MIKFIATDLDGTLLTTAKELPHETFDLIEQLHSRGILFAPASGRQYANLKKLFAPVLDKVVFICENGALVKYRDKTLLCSPIEQRYLKEALDEIRATPHLLPVLCGESCAYIEDDAQPFYDYSVAAYTNCQKVDSLDTVIGNEPVCKIAVYDGLGTAEDHSRELATRLPNLRTMLSGIDWCDISAPEIHKGVAIRVIQKYFGLNKEECVAFGDHMNDYEMLLECGQAFVPENGYPPLKERFDCIIPSNDDGGVIQKIREILSEEK